MKTSNFSENQIIKALKENEQERCGWSLDTLLEKYDQEFYANPLSNFHAIFLRV